MGTPSEGISELPLLVFRVTHPRDEISNEIDHLSQKLRSGTFRTQNGRQAEDNEPPDGYRGVSSRRTGLPCQETARRVSLGAREDTRIFKVSSEALLGIVDIGGLRSPRTTSGAAPQLRRSRGTRHKPTRSIKLRFEPQNLPQRAPERPFSRTRKSGSMAVGEHLRRAMSLVRKGAAVVKKSPVEKRKPKKYGAAAELN